MRRLLFWRWSPPRRDCLLAGVCLLGLAPGVWGGAWLLPTGAAAAVAALLLWRVAQAAARGRAAPDSRPATEDGGSGDEGALNARADEAGAEVANSEQLVNEMLRQERYALLLRPQIEDQISPAAAARARRAWEQAMAFTPGGEVHLQSWTSAAEDPGQEDRSGDRVAGVAAFYLDRHPVTNRQFQRFVDAGGYSQMQLWEPEVWGSIQEFVDATNRPGPRFWKRGRFPPGSENLPVVGVSWFEAAAYARWVGKRLPSDAEWVKAAAWPVSSGTGLPAQRKFPWGDTMDRAKANLWGSGPEKVVAVHEFSGGMSAGGVYQLVGNVWEWTHGDFAAWEASAGRLDLGGPMKVIRGGAFDTYFDRQGRCQFQSGDRPLARKHNIGFRCALGLCDLTRENADAAETT